MSDWLLGDSLSFNHVWPHLWPDRRMQKTSPLKKNSFTVWLHFRVLTALLATAVDAILPIVLSAMSDRHRALLSSIGTHRGRQPVFDYSVLRSRDLSYSYGSYSYGF
jgi:hypothetical protein